jgi:uncharacterized NAD(P)/FAD-binding protein YdhS
VSDHRPRRFVIVGGGASGVLMALHLLRGGHPDIRVTIVEMREQLGRGLAYATGNPSHLLNVRAANMSAFADDPDHFSRWLAARASRGRIAIPMAFDLFRANCMGFIFRNCWNRFARSAAR